jgi:hypothetical protein
MPVPPRRPFLRRRAGDPASIGNKFALRRIAALLGKLRPVAGPEETEGAEMSTSRWLAGASLVCTLLVPGCSSESSQPADAAIWQEAMGKDGLGFLDGRAFACQMSDGGAETTEETIEFHGGRFHSVGCDEHGFTTGTYASTRLRDTTSFQAVTTSKTEGRIDWRGMVRGNAIEGSAIWSKPGASPINYTFRGTEQPASN